MGDENAPPLEFFVSLKDEDVSVKIDNPWSLPSPTSNENDTSCQPPATTISASKERVADPMNADSENTLDDSDVTPPFHSSRKKQEVIQLLS